MIQPTIKHQESEEKTSSRQNYAFCMAPAAPLVRVTDGCCWFVNSNKGLRISMAEASAQRWILKTQR